MEQQRRYHEERERLEDAMVQEKLLKKSSVRIDIRNATRHRANVFFPQGEGAHQLGTSDQGPVGRNRKQAHLDEVENDLFVS